MTDAAERPGFDPGAAGPPLPAAYGALDGTPGVAAPDETPSVLSRASLTGAARWLRGSVTDSTDTTSEPADEITASHAVVPPAAVPPQRTPPSPRAPLRPTTISGAVAAPAPVPVRAPAPRRRPIIEREAAAVVDDDTVFEDAPRRLNLTGRQRVRVVRGVRSRRLVRRIDVWTVCKLSFAFYVLLLAVVLAAGVITWNVAQAFGLVDNIEKSIRTLFDLKTFNLRPGPVLRYSAGAGAILVVLGTLFNVLLSAMYNLISDIVGGLQVVVVTDPD